MSYSILYDKQFIKVSDNLFLPMTLHGDNNVYEYDNKKRARDWGNDGYMVDGKIFGTAEQILGKAEYIRNYEKERSEEYKDSAFGWFTAISLYGKGTRGTTYSSFLNFYKQGIKQALTMEELKEFGVSLRMTVSIYDREKIEGLGLEIKPDVYFESTEHLIEKVKEYQEYYGNSISLYFRFVGESGLDRIKRSRKKAVVKKEKTPTTLPCFFVLDCLEVYGYLVKYTARGYRYAPYESSAKKFATEKAAVKFHDKLRNKEKFAVKKIEKEVVMYL